jgi:hypothetical protein
VDPISPSSPGAARGDARITHTTDPAKSQVQARPARRNEAFRAVLANGRVHGRLRDSPQPRATGPARAPAREPTKGDVLPSGRGEKPRRTTLADPPEHDPAPFLPLPGIVRPIRLTPVANAALGSADRAGEIAALVDRAVESLRVGHSTRGPEAHLRVRTPGARGALEVRLVADAQGAVEARIRAAPTDRGAAEALAESVTDALADQGVVDASVTVELE